MKIFSFFFIIPLINGFHFFNKPLKKIKAKKIKKNDKILNNKKLITIAPAGIYGFYELGVCDYIKKHYNLTNYIYSGASAGAWNSLFMAYKPNDDSLLNTILNINTTNIKQAIELEYLLKDIIIEKYNLNDFDLQKMYIGVFTFNNKKFKPEIYNDFVDLCDVLDCCIASSHIPIISGKILNYYRDKITLDGGFIKEPYLKTIEPSLHITPTIWKTNEPYIGLNFKVCNMIKKREYKLLVKQLKGFLNVTEVDPMKLYLEGYLDTLENKQILDTIFKKL
tara:strand:+ start:71 stop:907 length:837 start_codon:yes stop_codon:yes gene_type:complete